MLSADPTQTGARDRRLSGARGMARQLALVHHVGDEPAHVGMHPPRHVEQHTTIVGERAVDRTQQVLERAHTRTVRVARLRHLRQLLRIAEQDHVRRRDRRRQRVGQTELTRLVDHQHVDRVVTHRLAGEQPRCPPDHVVGPVAHRPFLSMYVNAVDRPALGLAYGPQLVTPPRRTVRPPPPSGCRSLHGSSP